MAFAGLVAEQYVLINAFIIMCHIFIVLGSRIFLIHTGRLKPQDVKKTREQKEDSFIGRVSCSHVNCLENFPLFLAVVLIARSTSIDLAFLCAIYVSARLAQCILHIVGVTEELITMRFLAFLTQLVCLVTMIAKVFPALS